jgi:hypothetical protein
MFSHLTHLASNLLSSVVTWVHVSTVETVSVFYCSSITNCSFNTFASSLHFIKIDTQQWVTSAVNAFLAVTVELRIVNRVRITGGTAAIAPVNTHVVMTNANEIGQ